LAHVHVGRSPEAVWGKFALDSPLEGDGFEPSVPRTESCGCGGLEVVRSAVMSLASSIIP
jgi:hypothetical protein